MFVNSIDHSSNEKGGAPRESVFKRPQRPNSRVSYTDQFKTKRTQRLFTARNALAESLSAKTTDIAVGGLNLKCVDPQHAPSLNKTHIIDPISDMPEYFVKVGRTADGKPQLTIPEYWQSLGPVIYMWIDENGKMLIGRTTNLPARLSQYMADLYGIGNHPNASMPKAWREGKDLYFGILHQCSTPETAKLWETIYIVSKESYIIGHNDNIGNGEPDLLNGSPQKGSPDAIRLRLYEEDSAPRNEEVTDPAHYEPKQQCQLAWNEAKQKFYWDFPKGKENWDNEQNVVYQFSDEKGKVYIGETTDFKKRMKSWLKQFNSQSSSYKQALVRAVKRGVKFSMGVLYRASCEKTRLQWETTFIVQKKAYYNGNIGHGDPSLLNGSPARQKRWESVNRSLRNRPSRGRALHFR